MFYRRALLDPLRSRVSENKVRVLLGARQTGKTALLSALIPPDESALFNLQDSALRRSFEEDPSRFGRQVRALPPATRYVVVDEIQKVPALLDEVQSLYDESPRARQFFLTGSSARRLLRGSANLLPGRAHLYRLLPVARPEQAGHVPYLDLLSAAAPADRPAGDSPPPFPARSLERMLLFGCLPGVMQEAATTAAATLAAYVELYLEEEIRREALVRDLGAFSVFLRLTAVESGKIVNLAGLSRESGIPQSTLKSFQQILRDTFVGFDVPVYGRPGRKRLLGTPKFFLFDGGVRNAAARFSFDEGILAAEGGPLLEHWVGTELHVRAHLRGPRYAVSFWRTAGGAEVDFVFETPDEDVPIEVKWTTRPSAHDARHIESFMSDHPRRSRRGLVVCRCERAEQITDRVTAIPWSAL